MKRTGFLLASLLLLANIVFAQSIEEGRKFLNYERFESAEKIFQQMVNSDPKNTEAIYWLGQTYLQNSDLIDTAAAKQVYQKGLQDNPNNPLLMVGMGEVSLLEGNAAEARNMFETAISSAKKRDQPEILVAVGRANVDMANGSTEYAITKLKEAQEKDRKGKLTDIYMVMGDAYRKMIDGANATLSYQQAISADPNNARAYFMIGRIYETQGVGQEPVYMKYYQDAIAADPNFAPVYYWLYNYYYQRDVNKAQEYLQEYVKHADQDTKNCYAEASLFYVSKKYEEAIAKADNCISTAPDGKPFPNLYGLKAYAYNKLGDSVNARKNFEEFFQRVNPEKIGPNDYATFAEVLMKFNDDETAQEYINKAIELDTVPENKLNYVRDLAKTMYDAGRFNAAGRWYAKILDLTPDFGKVDLYWTGYSFLRAGEYKTADSVFSIYQEKYPEDLYGWYLGAVSTEGMDTAQTGMAFPEYQRIVEIADTMTDKQADKDKILPAYRFMVAYYYNLKGDVDQAAKFTDMILAIDPQDANALSNKEAFETIKKQQANRQKNPQK